jgi:hypothetical protein
VTIRGMKFRVLGILTAGALLAPTALLATASSSEAAASGTYYSSCTKLAQVYPHGVAKGYAAAMTQVRQGHGRPAYGLKARSVYWTNHTRLDRDGDGTACER